MIVLLTAAAIILISAVRALSFAVWQFKNRNILGGIMVVLLSLGACFLTFKMF